MTNFIRLFKSFLARAYIALAVYLALYVAVAFGQPAAAAPLPDPTDISALLVKLYANVMSGDWRAVASVLVIAVVWVVRHDSLPFTTWVPFLKTDRGGVVLVLAVSVLGGVGTALAASGPLTVPLFITCVGNALFAAGGFNLLKKFIAPKDSTEDVRVAQAAAKAAAVSPASSADPLNK